MKKYKLISLLAVFLVGILALSGIANAATPFSIDELELNEDALNLFGGNPRDLKRGEEFEVKIHLHSTIDVEDVQVEVELRGYDHNDRVEAISDVFDLEANDNHVEELTLKFADRLEPGKYRLRVEVQDRYSEGLEQDYELNIKAQKHFLTIKDVVFSPENTVRAGRALLTTVRVANDGDTEEEGVKVKVSIPALGISASDYIDELKEEGDDDGDDVKTSEELYMRIPECAESGDYKVRVEVIYDDGDEKVTKESMITVTEGEFCSASVPDSKPKTIITVGVESQDVTQGQGGAVYPLTLTNMGTATRSYTVNVEGVDTFGASRISPSNFVVLGAGETKALYTYISANENAPVGGNVFALTISSGGNVLQQLTLKANILEKASTGWSKIKRALEVGLVILAIVLVILGLIIGFSKLKGREDSEDTESQTYY